MESAEDTDAEYAERLARLRGGSGNDDEWTRQFGTTGCVRGSVALRELEERLLGPLLQTPARLWQLDHDEVPADVAAELQQVHGKLARGAAAIGSAFQRQVVLAAARPPWPPLAVAGAAMPWSLQAAVRLWTETLGASFTLAYALPPDHVVLVFAWSDESAHLTAFAIVCRAPQLTRRAVYTAGELDDVAVQWPSGEAPADGSDRGAVAFTRSLLTYVGAGHCESRLARVIPD